MLLKLYYKVCCRGFLPGDFCGIKEDDWTSACQHPLLNAHARCVYRIGQWTKPKIKKSKLFIFSTMPRAKKFEKEMRAYKLHPYLELATFEAECVNVTQTVVVPSLVDVTKFWEYFREGKINMNHDAHTLLVELNRLDIVTMERPSYSYWCDQVKLLRQV